MNNQQNNMYAGTTSNTNPYYYPPNVQPFLLGTNSILPHSSVQQSYTLNSFDVTQSRFVVNTFQINGQMQNTPTSVSFPQQTNQFLDSMSGRSVAQLGQPLPQGQYVAGPEITSSLPDSVYSSISTLSNISNRTPPPYPNCSYNQTVSTQFQGVHQQNPLQMVSSQIPSSQHSLASLMQPQSHNQLVNTHVQLHQSNQLQTIPSQKSNYQPNQLQVAQSHKQNQQPSQLGSMQSVPLQNQHNPAQQVVPSQLQQNCQVAQPQVVTSRIQPVNQNQIQAHQQNTQKVSVNNSRSITSNIPPTCVANAAHNIHKVGLNSVNVSCAVNNGNNNNKITSNRNTQHSLVGSPRLLNPPNAKQQNLPVANQKIHQQSNVHMNPVSRPPGISLNTTTNIDKNHSKQRLIRPALPQMSSASLTNKHRPVVNRNAVDESSPSTYKDKRTKPKFPVYTASILQGTEPIVIEPIEGYTDDDDDTYPDDSSVPTSQYIQTNAPMQQQPKPSCTKSSQINTNEITPQTKLPSPSRANTTSICNNSNEVTKSPKSTCGRTKSMQEHLVEKLQKTSLKNISSLSLDNFMREYRDDISNSRSDAQPQSESSDDLNSSGSSIVDQVMGAIRNMGKKRLAGKPSEPNSTAKNTKENSTAKNMKETDPSSIVSSSNTSISESSSSTSLNSASVTLKISKDGTSNGKKASQFVKILPKPTDATDTRTESILTNFEKTVQSLSQNKDTNDNIASLASSVTSSNHTLLHSRPQPSNMLNPKSAVNKKPPTHHIMIQPAGVPHRFKVIDATPEKVQSLAKTDHSKSENSGALPDNSYRSELERSSYSQSKNSQSPTENPGKNSESVIVNSENNLLKFRLKLPNTNLRNKPESPKPKNAEVIKVNEAVDTNLDTELKLDVPKNKSLDSSVNTEQERNDAATEVNKHHAYTALSDSDTEDQQTSFSSTQSSTRNGQKSYQRYCVAQLSIQLDPVDYILRGKDHISMRQFESRMLQAIYYPEKRLKDTSKSRHERYLKRTHQENKRKTRRSHRSKRQRSVPCEIPFTQRKLQETLSIMDELRHIASDSESNEEPIYRKSKRKRIVSESSDDETDDDYRPKNKIKKKSHKGSNASKPDNLPADIQHQLDKQKENQDITASECATSHENEEIMSSTSRDKVKKSEPVSSLLPFRHIQPKVTPDSPNRTAIITNSKDQALIASPSHSHLLGLATSPLHASSIQPALQPSNITLLINQPSTGPQLQTSLSVTHAQPQLAQVQTSTLQLQAPGIHIQTQPTSLQLQAPALPIQAVQQVQLQSVVTPIQNVLPASNILNVSSRHNNSFQSP